MANGGVGIALDDIEEGLGANAGIIAAGGSV